MNLKDVPVIDLDLYYRESNQPDYLKTDDANGRYRKYRLAYGGTPMDLTGVTARCYMMKADGKSVYIDAEIEGNVVTVCFTNQALACPGVLKVEIVLYGSDNSEISSFIMEYVVIKSLRNPDTLESTNEFSALVSTINTVNDLQAKEQLIQAREAVRIANEDTRIATEATRESDEETRKNNEVTRQSNETTRVASENTREGKEFTRQQDEITRKANEVTRQSNEVGRVNAESTRVAEFNDIKNQWNSLSPDQASNVEVQQARRDVRGVVHDSLTKRLESDSKMRDTLEETKEGTYLTFDGSVPSPITNVIVKGNTYQNPNNLVEIVSSGIDNGDGTWTYEVVACGENLNAYTELGDLSSGDEIPSTTSIRSAYIKVRKGDTIGCKFQLDDGSLSNEQVWVYRFDSAKKFLGNELASSNPIPIAHDGYIRLKRTKGSIKEIVATVNAIPTRYTPYQETRCDIKLPCQLEKVYGLGQDRLYFDKLENAWCVDKNIVTLDFIPTILQQDFTNANLLRMKIEGVLKYQQWQSKQALFNRDELLYATGWDDVANIGKITTRISATHCDVVCPKSVTNVSQGVEYSKGIIVKGVALNPQKIVLPQSEQIKLNALANQTNIYVNSGALDAIISATVAKSHTSATLANTDKINDVENRLQKVIDNKDDVEYTYKSTNGYIVAKDTNRGNISKATINGKSLVNICPKRTTRAVADGVGHVGDTIYLSHALDDSKKYTIMFKITENSTTDKAIIGLYDKDGSGKASFVLDDIVLLNKGKYMYKTVILDSRYSEAISIKVLCRPTSPVGTILEVDDLMLIEGAIDEVLPYFDRIGSVYNPNGLELRTIEKSLDYVTELVTAQKRKNFRLTKPIQPNSVITNVSDKPIIALLFDIASPDTWTQDITIAPGASYTIPTNRIAKIITIYPHNGWRIESDIYLEELIDIDGYPRRDTNKIFYKDNDGEYQVLTELQEFDTLDLTNCEYSQRTGEVVSTDIKDVYVVATKTDNFVIGFDLVNKADGANLGMVISDKYAFIGEDEKVQIRLGNSGNSIFISDKKTKFTSLDKNGAIAYIKANPFRAIYPLRDYTTYETNALSLGVFDGDTLVTTNATNVKPGFDATITSSINSLIGNIDDTLDSAVEDIQALKHDVAKITSSKAYEFSGVGSKLMNETERGTLSELQIYGKSLVNLKDAVFKYENVYIAVSFKRDLLPNTTYTVILNGFNKDNFRYHVCYNGDGSQSVYSSSDRMVVFTTPSNLINNARRVYIYPNEGYTITQNDVDTLKPLILEGDHTQSPPSYFEGIASVGTVGGIAVRSHNGNLFNESLLRHRLEDDGYYHFRSSGNTRASLFMGIVDKSNKQITAMTSNQANDLTNLDLTDCKVLIGMNGDVKDDKELMPITEFGLGNFPIYKGCDYDIVNPNHIRVKSVYIKHGIEPGNYVPYESDTKPVLYRDVDNTWKRITELRGIDVNRRDTIDTNSGLYTNSLNMVIEDGSGNWQISDNAKTNTIMFLRMFTESERCELLENNANILCDKLHPRYVYSSDVEGIFINRNMASSNGGVYVRINRSSLTTPDVPGLTKWLQTNNVSYIYKRGDVRKYEINPILTQVFDDSTLLQILGGAVPSEFMAKCIASYSRRIESIESRLDRVEDSVFKAVDVVSAMAMATDLHSINLSNNVAQTQQAQDTMLMESDMRLMSMELLVNSTKPVSTDIKYVMYDAKGGATIMSASYYNFIAMCIENKTQSPEYLENYMNLCLQTGRLDQDEFDKLHAMLYPTTTEQPTK